jgi:hypothetical protein
MDFKQVGIQNTCGEATVDMLKDVETTHKEVTVGASGGS